MNTGILIIAHAPLASALRAGVLHVFPDVELGVLALDVPALRQRRDDLEALAEYFFHAYAAERAPRVRGFSAQALRAIRTRKALERSAL